MLEVARSHRRVHARRCRRGDERGGQQRARREGQTGLGSQGEEGRSVSWGGAPEGARGDRGPEHHHPGLVDVPWGSGARVVDADPTLEEAGAGRGVPGCRRSLLRRWRSGSRAPGRTSARRRVRSRTERSRILLPEGERPCARTWGGPDSSFSRLGGRADGRLRTADLSPNCGEIKVEWNALNFQRCPDDILLTTAPLAGDAP